jgi:hypothetical protein
MLRAMMLCAALGALVTETNSLLVPSRSHGATPSAMHLRGGGITETKDRPSACITCGKKFSQSGNLDASQSGNLDTHKCLCPTCGKFFAPEKLDSHKIECAPPTDSHVHGKYSLWNSEPAQWPAP